MITWATPPVCPRGSARGGVSHDLEVSPWWGGVSEPEVPDGFLGLFLFLFSAVCVCVLSHMLVLCFPLFSPYYFASFSSDLMSAHALLGVGLVPFLTVVHSFPLQQEELKLELRQDFQTLTSHQNGEEKKLTQLEEGNAKKSMN